MTSMYPDPIKIPNVEPNVVTSVKVPLVPNVEGNVKTFEKPSSENVNHGQCSMNISKNTRNDSDFVVDVVTSLGQYDPHVKTMPKTFPSKSKSDSVSTESSKKSQNEAFVESSQEEGSKDKPEHSEQDEYENYIMFVESHNEDSLKSI